MKLTPQPAPQAQPKIRVLVVDDHTLVRRGTRALLELLDDIEVTGEAANGAEAIALAEALQPDVVLMDLMMPEVNGVAATEAIVAAHPDMHVIAVTSFGAEEMLLATVRAGALGYLHKDAEPDALVQAIRQVARGEPYLTPEMTRHVLAQYKTPPPPLPAVDPLTERELLVLKRVANGRSNGEIAAELSISEVTVRTHISHLLGKLQCENRVQATLYALRSGIVVLDDAPPPRNNL
jgi:NarL family two-component system response regulator LiaR